MQSGFELKLGGSHFLELGTKGEVYVYPPYNLVALI
jgi:hypothetical protein